MDLSELKQQSDASFDIATAKKNALEKAFSQQILVYNQSIFVANAETINLVATLKQSHKTFVVLDSNDNPCIIAEPAEFLTKLIEKNQEALNQYHHLYETFRKKI
jgi:hypothetical protein